MATIERDEEARAFARHWYGGNAIFKDLPVGTRFVFRREDAFDAHKFLVKTRAGYRYEISGRKFKTGARTAVYRLAAQTGYYDVP